MKLALAQINTTVGAVPENTRLILEWIDRAAEQGADLVVFPELAITGYPPNDLLEHRSLTDASLEALEQIAGATAGAGRPGVIVGYLDRHEAEGKGIYNAAALLDGGRVVSRHFKSLLPTYDVFDEARYFEPAREVRVAEFRGRRLAITICEDFWNDRLYWKRRSYLFDPVEELAKQSPDLMVTISASPYWVGKARIRDEMYAAATKRHGVPLVHVNLVAGNDSLIFDGRSNVWSREGRKLAEARPFEEDLLVFDLARDAGTGWTIPPALEQNEEIYRALCLGLRDYVRKCRFTHVLIALSGGIDSALTAAIAVDALGREAVTGVALPSAFSSEHSVADAEALARHLGIRFHRLPIGPIYDQFLATLEPLFKGLPFNVAEENIQARVRGNLIMAISNKFDWLVLTTGNKSELAVGYCTLYGDMSGGLAVISDLLKTRVYALSRWVNRNGERIPQHTIDKPPSAELRPGQLDSDSLPPYEKLDPIIEAYVERHLHTREIIAEGHDAATVERIVRMIDRNEYKRQQAAPGLKVTSKAFGIGRRMPIARGDWG